MDKHKTLLFDPELTSFEIEKHDEEHVIMNKIVTKEELLTAAKKIKKSKASGLYQVLNEMILCTVEGQIKANAIFLYS